MAYATGTATDPHDALDKLRTFLVANGWAQNGWADDDTGYDTGWTGLGSPDGKRLHVSRASSVANGSVDMYFNFKSCIYTIPFEDNEPNTTGNLGDQYSAVDGIAINGSTGYDGGETWDYQPGGIVNEAAKSSGCCITGMIESYINYWFYQNGDCTHAIFEISIGKFMHMAFGCLDKAGTIAGGQFCMASIDGYHPNRNYNALTTSRFRTRFGVYHDETPAGWVLLTNIDGDSLWSPIGETTTNYVHISRSIAIAPNEQDDVGSAAYPDGDLAGLGEMIVSSGPNTFNGLAAMMPFYIFARRTSTNYSLLGWPADIRYICCESYDPGAELTLGADTWMVFPMHCKTTDGGAVVNGGPGCGGIAILKEV